jgi:membrane associated rhomboid family serine protease
VTSSQRWREILRDRILPEYALEEWRVTQLLVVTVLLVYNAEIVVRLALGAPTVRLAMDYSFLNYPKVAWPLAPVLHRDALHLGANVLMLVVLAPVEARMTRRQFLVLVAVSAYVSVLCGALWLLTFTEKGFVAFYGISGTVFAMAGYGLVASVGDYRAGEEVSVPLAFMGVVVIVAVVLDVWGAVTGGPLALNMGHTTGIALGVSLDFCIKWS